MESRQLRYKVPGRAIRQSDGPDREVLKFFENSLGGGVPHILPVWKKLIEPPIPLINILSDGPLHQHQELEDNLEQKQKRLDPCWGLQANWLQALLTFSTPIGMLGFVLLFLFQHRVSETEF